MSGDYSRQRFKALKDYCGVLMQQGRVQLDADWNELVEILDRRLRAETVDILGCLGCCIVSGVTPGSFQIQPDGDSLKIGLGRIYVDGLLAENHGKTSFEFDPVLAELRGTQPIDYTEQPYWPIPDPLSNLSPGTHLVYIDVWQREVNYLQDSALVENAVGVDTTTRLQTVWQVRVLPDIGDVTCATSAEVQAWLDLIQPSAGRLSTGTVQVPSVMDPCLLPPSSGYRGLENRFYRVEIHTAGLPGTATFKWSRDNASVATAVTALSSRSELKVAQTGRDAVLRFGQGDWIEIIDDRHEFNRQQGFRCKIVTVDDSTRTITLTSPLPQEEFPVDPQDPSIPKYPMRIRRWDQKGEGEIRVADGSPILLEDGVQITFSTEPSGGQFNVGDYWVFAARSADGSVEPLTKAPPRGIIHHCCPLAIVSLSLDKEQHRVFSLVEDCRKTFPPSIDREPGVQIKEICIGSGGKLNSARFPLPNDSDVKVDDLIQGIEIVCSEGIDPSSFRRRRTPTCFVTVEVPYPFLPFHLSMFPDQSDLRTFPSYHFNLSTFAYQSLVLDAEVWSNGTGIFWQPTEQTRRLPQPIVMMQKQVDEMHPRSDHGVLTRLTLKGNFIWAKDPKDPRKYKYLDGDAFGIRRSEPTGNDLSLPSGDGRRGGDFTMWFWLHAPELHDPELLPSLFLIPREVIGGVPSTGWVILDRPAPAGGVTIDLDSSDQAIAEVPGHIHVPPGWILAWFVIQTRSVNEELSATITATFEGNIERSEVLQIKPLQIY